MNKELRGAVYSLSEKVEYNPLILWGFHLFWLYTAKIIPCGIQGAKVEMSYDGKVIATATTDKEGNYIFNLTKKKLNELKGEYVIVRLANG